MASAIFAPTSTRSADQAQKVARVAFVDPYSASASTNRETSEFWMRLQELGWIRGQNLAAETRWADGQVDRLPALMANLVASKIDVIVTRGAPAAKAARNATNTIPIVVAVMGDPVAAGFAVSLARPGSNLTGLSLEASEDRSGKWLELLQETVPHLSAVAVIANADSSQWLKTLIAYLESAAR